MQIFLNLLEIIILPGSFAGFFCKILSLLKYVGHYGNLKQQILQYVKKKTTQREFTKNCYIAGVMG